MLIKMAEPALLGAGLDSGCELPGAGSAFVAVELVCVPGFGVAGLELVGPPVESDWGRASAAPVLGVGVRAGLRARTKSEYPHQKSDKYRTQQMSPVSC